MAAAGASPAPRQQACWSLLSKIVVESDALKTMAVETVDSTILVYHTKEKPSDDEWEVFVEAIRTARPGMNTLVVAPDGGGPNAPQRKRMAQAFAAQVERIPAAVLLNSLLQRGLITAFK